MSDVPADWYDDPEYPDQYRYWDGSQWTEHRAPKRVSGSQPGFDQDNAGAIVSTGWSLFWRNWKTVLVIGLASLAVFVVALIIAAVFVNQALDPGIFTIVEEFSEPGFDPVNDERDEAFVDSITFDPSPVFWVVVPLIFLAAFAVQGFGLGVAGIHLAADHVQRPHTLGESFRAALVRLPRWIGIYLLWTLVYLLAVVALVLVFVVSAQLPILLIATIPGVIAFVIWAYPFIWLASTPLIVGPTDEPPFRSAAAKIRSTGWGSVAAKVFLINLVIFGISFALGVLGLIPIIGFVFSLVGNSLVYALSIAMNVPLWQAIGGRFGTDITGPETASADPATGIG